MQFDITMEQVRHLDSQLTQALLTMIILEMGHDVTHVWLYSAELLGQDVQLLILPMQVAHTGLQSTQDVSITIVTLAGHTTKHWER